MEKLFQTLKLEGVLTPFNFARVVEKATKYVLFEKKFLGEGDYSDVQGSNSGTKGVVKFIRQVVFHPDSEQAVNEEKTVSVICLPSDDVADVAIQLFTLNWGSTPYSEKDIEYVSSCIETNDSEFHSAVGRVKQMLI